MVGKHNQMMMYVGIYLLGIATGVVSGFLLMAILAQNAAKTDTDAEELEMKADYERGKAIERRNITILEHEFCVAIMRDERTALIGLARIPDSFAQMDIHIPEMYKVRQLESGLAVVVIRKPFAFELRTCAEK